MKGTGVVIQENFFMLIKCHKVKELLDAMLPHAGTS